MSFQTFNHGPEGAGDSIAVSVKDGDNADFTEVYKLMITKMDIQIIDGFTQTSKLNLLNQRYQ